MGPVVARLRLRQNAASPVIPFSNFTEWATLAEKRSVLLVMDATVAQSIVDKRAGKSARFALIKSSFRPTFGCRQRERFGVPHGSLTRVAAVKEAAIVLQGPGNGPSIALTGTHGILAVTVTGESLVARAGKQPFQDCHA